jgi:3-deoxy-D-arabino-heptulosonate 7-phosphate (DAHP) synthase
MTPEQIVANHIKNNNLDTTKEQMIAEINGTLKQKHAFAVRSGDCMFIYKVSGNSALFYIVNGGNAMGYIKAIKEFFATMKKANIRLLQMYVDNTTTAERLAKTAGAISVSFKKDEKRKVDPYLMSMEI